MTPDPPASGSGGASGSGAAAAAAIEAAAGAGEGDGEAPPKKKQRRGKELQASAAPAAAAAGSGSKAAAKSGSGGSKGDKLATDAAERAAAQEAPAVPPAANGPRATLIVCPLSVVSNWEMQIQEHTADGLSGGLSGPGVSRCAGWCCAAIGLPQPSWHIITPLLLPPLVQCVCTTVQKGTGGSKPSASLTW